MALGSSSGVDEFGGVVTVAGGGVVICVGGTASGTATGAAAGCCLEATGAVGRFGGVAVTPVPVK